MSVSREDYEDGWCTWWTRISPDWRTQQNGCLVLGGEGDWSSMFMSGKNGFATVIGSVVGLLQVASQSTIDYAVTDLQWTLEKVVEAKQRTPPKE